MDSARVVELVSEVSPTTARRILRACVRGRDTEGWARLSAALGGRLPFRPDDEPDLAEAALDALDLVVSPEPEDETTTVTMDRSVTPGPARAR